MSDFSKAVFLSYASQDAEPAGRICDALRAAGIEVWFDQSELRGGDAWDAKIRKQIKECALFVPIISANTQARLEGYFRLEWKLAEDRSHLMAKGKPFIVPICIDDTKDWDAQVPDAFMLVQWTRLRHACGGQALEDPSLTAFCARLKTLLSGGASSSGTRERIALPAEGSETLTPSGTHTLLSQRRWLGIALTASVAVAALAIWRPWRAPGGDVSREAVSPEAEQLTTRALTIYAGVHNRPEVEMAEQMARRATELAPLSARAWAVRAGVEANYIFREFVSGQSALERARNAEEFANRALALNRNEVEALWALGETAAFQHATAQAESFYRRVFALDPRHNRARRSLTWVLRDADRLPEALAVMQEAIRIDPADALSRYDLAYVYERGWDFPRAATQLDAVIAARPFSSALISRAGLAAKWKGDLAAMRATLDRLDSLERGEDGAVFMAMWCGLLERKPERVFEAAGRTTRVYFEHPDFTGPKAWLAALAQQLAGRNVAAREQWAAAEAVLRERLRNDGGNQELRVQLATTLAWLGRADEAAREIEPIEAAWREDLTPARAKRLAAHYAAAGDAPRANPLLRQVLHGGNGMIGLTVPLLELDPWWDKLRESREFRALLTNPPPMPALLRATPVPSNEHVASRGAPGADAATKPDTKSIAVLAFDNLSDDKANEYFSDGISEELINALGRVPGLTVKGRTSAFYFKGNNKVSSAEIAQQLGVSYLVRGSVRKDARKVRIAAQLTRAGDDQVVWSLEPVTRDLENALALQEEIAGLIAQALQLKLGTSPQAARIVNPEAYVCVLEGRHFWEQRVEKPEAALAKAASAFQKALAIDSNFAEAHAGLGDVWVTRGLYRSMDGRGASADDDFARAKAEAGRALELNPGLAEPHVTLGYVAYCERQFIDAERHYARAFALNANYALAYHWHALLLFVRGRTAEGVHEVERSLRLDPLSRNTLWSATVMNYFGGHLAESLAFSERTLALQPDLLPMHGQRALIFLKLGRKDEAIAAAREVGRDLTVEPRWWADGDAIYVLRETGHEAEAVEHAKRVMANFPPDDYRRVLALAALGRFDDALQAVRAIPTIALSRLYWHPMWDSWRDDERFRELLVKLGCGEEYKAARDTSARVQINRETTK